MSAAHLGSRRAFLQAAAAGGSAAAVAVEEFHALGPGFCADLHGKHAPGLGSEDDEGPWVRANVRRDGSSSECADHCRASSACTGYVTLRSGNCGLIHSKSFLPSYAKGSSEAHCFWRHTYLHNSSNIYSGPRPELPKVIWTYWISLPSKERHPVLPSFIDLCYASWRQLNPDYEVRVLNDTSVWQWLNASDLPRDFEKLHIQHKSDQIRLALLVKYGGVWIDSSTLMVKPLADILGNDTAVRTFFTLDSYWLPEQLRKREHRVNGTFHIENWFFASPAQDPLFTRTRKCVMEIPAGAHSLASTGVFSRRQLDEFRGIGIWKYISTHACMAKVIDEDAALWRWWLSPRVRHVNPIAGIDPSVFNDPGAFGHQLFREKKTHVADMLTKGSVSLLKLTGPMRKYIVGPYTPEDLWCRDNTFRLIMHSIGMKTEKSCSELKM